MQAPKIRSLGSSSSRAARLARLARLARRARTAGFTLIELMVVVVLISILALIAAPGLRIARDDRMTFDYARQFQQMASRARARAAARGGAHLLVAGPSGVRGRVFLYEALDSSAPPLGPNPTSSCRGVGQWTIVSTFTPGVPVPPTNGAFIDGLDLNTAGVNVDADIRATFLMSPVGNPNALVPTPAFALCVTPNGTVFAAEGADEATAVTNMQTRAPFTGVAQIRVARTKAGVPVGLSRNVTIAGGAAARIQSQ